jgi:hypothetical protein
MQPLANNCVVATTPRLRDAYVARFAIVQATPEPSGRTSEHVMDDLGPNEQSAPVPRSSAM